MDPAAEAWGHAGLSSTSVGGRVGGSAMAWQQLLQTVGGSHDLCGAPSSLSWQWLEREIVKKEKGSLWVSQVPTCIYGLKCPMNMALGTQIQIFLQTWELPEFAEQLKVFKILPKLN